MTYSDSHPLTPQLKKRGVVEQREHAQRKRKKVDKPWRVCWRYRRTVGPHDLPPFLPHHSREFATEALAVAYMEKEKRATGMHPSTGKPWGPVEWWTEGPAT